MIPTTTRSLSIALLAQVVFCLVAAPIMAAEQWSPPVVAPTQDKAPADNAVKITAAFDASNVRPEEVSDAEQKRGKSQTAAGKTKGIAGGVSVQFEGKKSTKNTSGAQENSPSCLFVCLVDPSNFRLFITDDFAAAGAPGKTPLQVLPAFQPTGPPTA